MTTTKRDWHAYDNSLKARGSFVALFDERLLSRWEEGKRGRMGRPRLYSNAAMMAMLTVKFTFNLPNRQCEGFVECALQALGRTDLVVPDHTSISRRMRQMDASLAEAKVRATFEKAGPRRPNSTPSVAIDSTGLACTGPHSHREHKWGDDPGARRYRKVHVSTDPRTGEITAVEVTDSEGEGTGDPSLLVPLLDQHEKNTGWVPEEVLADGAYDSETLTKEVEARGATLICPPPVNGQMHLRKKPGKGGAITDKPGHEKRNQRLARRAVEGDDVGWKTDEGYHRRSLAETTNHRFVAAFGDRFKTRLKASQAVEVNVKARLLNLWRATEIELAGGYISFEAR